PGVTPVHGCEHAVRTRLHWEMKLRHEDREVAMGGNEIFVHIARMAGRVTKPQHAWHLGEAIEQVTERGRPAVRALAMIAVAVLSNQGDASAARPHPVFHFGYNRRDRSRRFSAARIRHHAERAELVATLLNRHESGDAAGANCLSCRRRKVSELI